VHDGSVPRHIRVEVDGRRVDAETLWSTTTAFAHFTAMQVRGGRTRGLTQHLERLEMANAELFGALLDRDRVRELIRRALADVDNASVRVYMFEAEPQPAIMVTVREPAEATTPQRVRSVHYQRPDAHLKHLATEQRFHSRAAQRSGFDDALFTTPEGLVAETAIANIGFLDGSDVVWPDAPCLHGITMQLLEEQLPSRRAAVRLEDISSFEGAFLSNSHGVAAVSEVDGDALAVGGAQRAADAYTAVPWDAI
jgi:branched-subunit amino acid aminotransferase/4-amino-4-deoxychorismate lyase